jgi:ATP-dependent Clp protease ATP-binding subunit ClpB
VALQVRRVERRLADQKLNLAISDAAIDFIADSGYDPVYGARPLKRAIQRLLENPIATQILETPFPPGSTVTVDLVEQKLVFTSALPPNPLPALESPALVEVAMESQV